MNTEMFPLPLDVENLSDDSQYHYKLLSDFSFIDPYLGLITAKKDFLTDFASVPRLFKSFVDSDNESAPGATIHDWMYENHLEYGWTKEDADLVLFRALIANGISHEVATIFYDCVRYFGHNAWNSHKDVTPGPEILETNPV